MNDEQIVLSLLNFYRNEGIDLHQILDDPIFNSLPLQSKIDMIKRHAQAIHDGIHPGFSRHELRGMGKSMLWHGILGGITGATASKTTAKLFSGGRPTPAAIALGATAGAVSALSMSALRRLNAQAEKKELRDKLLSVAQNPSDEAALHTLAKRNLQNSLRAENSSAFNKFLDRIAQKSETIAADTAMQETVRFNTAAGRKMTGQSN